LRTLVLGGTNFIGRTIAERLVETQEVTLLNRGSRPVGDGRMARLVADRTDVEELRHILAAAGTFDAVVDVSATEAVQVRGLLDAWGDAVPQRYVLISSAAVYSPTTPQPRVEEGSAAGDPAWGAYGEEKAGCERILRERGLAELTVLRPPYVYGPGNNEEREQWLWARMAAGTPIFVPGTGQARIQFCYVGFLATVVAAAVAGALPAGTYNVGEERAYTFDEYLDALAVVSALVPALVHVGASGVKARSHFPFRDTDLVLDTARLRERGFEHPLSLLEGLAETWRWFSEQGLPSDEPTEQEREWRRRPPGATAGDMDGSVSAPGSRTPGRRRRAG
jgi:nucleoside-diphosphate-sugar epimerase